MARRRFAFRGDFNSLGGIVVKMPDGAFITYRPPGVSSEDTLQTTTTVEVNDPVINQLNGGRRLKLKFPKK